jgi:hypothetical protein
MQKVMSHKKIYQLRLDDSIKRNPTYLIFCKKLDALFRASFDETVIIQTIRSSDQESDVLSIIKSFDKVICLDPLMNSVFRIDISRLYDFADPNSFKRHVSRPGFPSLSYQTDLIPFGTYKLLDDDSISGGTLQFAKSIMPKSVIIEDSILMSSDIKILDIVDYRDFLLGYNLGRLVVELPNSEIVRVPYALPYVYPSDRVSIPIENNVVFSIAVWNMNLEYYIETNELVEDVDMPTKKLLYYIGFTDKHPMAYVCRWHLALFNM